MSCHNTASKEIIPKQILEKDLDIDQIFNELISRTNLEPNTYDISFELDSLKELFEFLIQLFTMLSKHFYGNNETGQVNLEVLTPQDFEIIIKYIMVIGFKPEIAIVPANAHFLNFVSDYRYDKIPIDSQTKLSDLILGLKCNTKLYIISFTKL